MRAAAAAGGVAPGAAGGCRRVRLLTCLLLLSASRPNQATRLPYGAGSTWQDLDEKSAALARDDVGPPYLSADGSRYLANGGPHIVDGVYSHSADGVPPYFVEGTTSDFADREPSAVGNEEPPYLDDEVRRYLFNGGNPDLFDGSRPSREITPMVDQGYELDLSSLLRLWPALRAELLMDRQHATLSSDLLSSEDDVPSEGRIPGGGFNLAQFSSEDWDSQGRQTSGRSSRSSDQEEEEGLLAPDDLQSMMLDSEQISGAEAAAAGPVAGGVGSSLPAMPPAEQDWLTGAGIAPDPGDLDPEELMVDGGVEPEGERGGWSDDDLVLGETSVDEIAERPLNREYIPSGFFGPAASYDPVPVSGQRRVASALGQRHQRSEESAPALGQPAGSAPVGGGEAVAAASTALARRSDTMFIVSVVGATTLAVLIAVSGGFWYRRLQRRRRLESDTDPPHYGVTGPHRDAASQAGRQAAESAAHMYHYQHQKHRMMAIQEGQELGTEAGAVSDGSEDEQEESDRTVYECPGLAPSSDMEVKNPLYQGVETPQQSLDDAAQP